MNRDQFWLTDEQFSKIEPHLPADTRGKARVDDRRAISGIVHVLKSGGRWIDAPAEYGPRKTLYNRYVRWAAKGVWAGLRALARMVLYLGRNHTLDFLLSADDVDARRAYELGLVTQVTSDAELENEVDKVATHLSLQQMKPPYWRCTTSIAASIEFPRPSRRRPSAASLQVHPGTEIRARALLYVTRNGAVREVVLIAPKPMTSTPQPAE